MNKKLGLGAGVALTALIGAVLTVATAQTGSAQKAGGEKNRIEPGTPLITSIDGGALFHAYCGSCHGSDARGVGPMTQWLKITAPDLTRLSIRNGGMFPLANVQRVISGEGAQTPGHGNREMPVWGPIFSQVTNDQDLGKMRVYNLAKYLETIQAK